MGAYERCWGFVGVCYGRVVTDRTRILIRADESSTSVLPTSPEIIVYENRAPKAPSMRKEIELEGKTVLQYTRLFLDGR